jgi:hypothetical protein
MDIQASSTAANAFAKASGSTGAPESAAQTQKAPQAIQETQVAAEKADVTGGKVLDIKV